MDMTEEQKKEWMKNCEVRFLSCLTYVYIHIYINTSTVITGSIIAYLFQISRARAVAQFCFFSAFVQVF